MTHKQIQDEVIQKYNVVVVENSTCWRRTHAHTDGSRRVCKWKRANSVKSTFTLLHEVGHIVTLEDKANKRKWRRAEKEYYATMWAIARCREYGITIPRSLYNLYQNYISMTMDRGIRRGGSGYCDMVLPDDVVNG